MQTMQTMQEEQCMNTPLRLMLTADQIKQLRPLLAKANAPASPDVVVVGQISRTDWREGGELVVTVSIIPRPIAEKMRATFVKESAKPPVKRK